MKYKFYGWKSADIPPITDEYKGIKNPRDLYDALTAVWSSGTCAPRLRNNWSIENRTLGQCSITAFLAQDIFGGKVYGILRGDDNFHCYNVIGDCIFDLTSEQFGDEELNYMNNPEQFREIHFAKEEKHARYEYLKSSLKRLCDKGLFQKKEMRRKDREVSDFDTIIKLIDSCNVVRLGISDEKEADFPYIVPMNFAYSVLGGKIFLYVHGARAGRRWELLQNTEFCSVQMDCDDGLELIPSARDITERYKCVMAKARLRLLAGDELVKGIELCVARDKKCQGFDWNRAVLERVAVWEIELFSISAKWNKIHGNAD